MTSQVISGSRMATVWANVATAPVSGFALLHHMTTVALPASVDAAYVDRAWNLLNELAVSGGLSPLPYQLLCQAGGHYAELTYFSYEWRKDGCPEDVVAYCQSVRFSKVYPEVRIMLAKLFVL